MTEAEKRWAHVDPESSPGVDYLPVAIGSEFTSADVVAAYRKGLFPWPPGDAETRARVESEIDLHVPDGTITVVEPLSEIEGFVVPWYSPRERGVLELEDIHVPKSLPRKVRSSGWTTTADRSFEDVVALCAARDADDSWITPHLRHTYSELHRQGYAHSIEVWDGEELVGGAFGVITGTVFTGEATFFLRSDASKVAILDLAVRVRDAGGEFLDTQVLEPPMVRLGAKNIDREAFLERLRQGLDKQMRLSTAPREAAAAITAFTA